jgi:hypothetical protein
MLGPIPGETISKAFVFASVIVVAVLALAWIGQRRLIYFPDTSTPSLDRAGLARAEAVTFTTDDVLRSPFASLASIGHSVSARRVMDFSEPRLKRRPPRARSC